jgi:hypothetical protein
MSTEGAVKRGWMASNDLRSRPRAAERTEAR